MLSSLLLTKILACTIITICVLTGLMRRHNLISALNLYLLVDLCSFGIRPLLAASEGGYLHYHVSVEWSEYNLVLIDELTFLVSYVLAYMIATRRLPRKLGGGTVEISTRSVLLCWIVGTTALAIIHVLSHGAWLPGKRTETITSLVPFGKILFPAVVLPLSVMLPMAFSIGMTSSGLTRIWMWIIGGIGLVEVALAYQRGFLIYSLALILLAYRKLRGKLPAMPTLGIVAFAALLLFAMRPVVRTLTGSTEVQPEKQSSGFVAGLKDNMLFTATFDLPDVGVVVREYSQQAGLHYGKTFLYDFGRILPPATRLEHNIQTITDSVNIFYWGDVYVNSHIGLAISLSDILFANFSYFGLFLGFIPGLMTAWLDNRLARINKLTPRTITLAYAALFSNGFSSEPGGLAQWMGAILLIGFFVQWLCEPKPPKAPLRRRPEIAYLSAG
jgi:hypothetical protein